MKFKGRLGTLDPLETLGGPNGDGFRKNGDGTCESSVTVTEQKPYLHYIS